MTTYEFLIKKWFSHQKTLDTYGFQCYWMGLPPRLCPGLYASINYMEPDIGYQVLAVMMMREGASIDPVVKGKMVAAALGDQWAKEDSEREETIHGLVKALRKYNGKTPILVKSRGLFQVMAENLSSEKENKN